jgi:hypothetical protein
MLNLDTHATKVCPNEANAGTLFPWHQLEHTQPPATS